MKTRMVSWTGATLLGLALWMLPACSSDENPGKGTVEFQITDAPCDDASIQGVFVTVADLKVDGQSVSGFSRQTIDVKAWQDGKVKSLVTAQLGAKAYNYVVLVLDADADAGGTGPGCYVLTTDGTKFKLGGSGKIDLVVSNNWTVKPNQSTTIVMDFDLRKSIKAVAEPSIRYAFVANLQGSVRLVPKDKAGYINGSYSEQAGTNAERIIVYAYKKGTYSASVETTAQGSDAVFFVNAFASAEVKSGFNGKFFKLHFLEEGEYELHFASYTRPPGTEPLILQNMLHTQLTLNGSVGQIVNVQHESTVSVSTLVLGPI